MANVTRVAAQARPDRRWYHEHPKRAFEDIEAGQAVYVRNDGRVAKANAAAAGTARVFGLTATAVRAGQTVTVVLRGQMTGFSGLAPGTYLWLSGTTAGELATTAVAAAPTPIAYVTTASEIELMCPAPAAA